MAEKGKGKAVSRSPTLSPQQDQEGTLTLEDLAAFGISLEEFEQDLQARDDLAVENAMTNILPASSPTSTGHPSTDTPLGISQEDYEEDRQVREALAKETSLPDPPSSPQAGPSRKRKASFNAPGRLAALDKRLSLTTTPRVRLDKDPFGVLESGDRKTPRPKSMHPMPTIDEQLEAVEAAERSLRRRALASSEPDVQAREDSPPPYDEGPMVLYQVIVRPITQLPVGCPYGYSHLRHNDGGPKPEILNLLKEAMALLGVDLVQDFEENEGFFFGLGSFRGAPFQTPGWQSLVEVRRMNEEDGNWEVITPFEESRIVKEAKARFMNQPASSDTENRDATPSANVAGDGSNDTLARNEEQTMGTTQGVTSLLDGAEETITGVVNQNVTVSVEDVDPDCS